MEREESEEARVYAYGFASCVCVCATWWYCEMRVLKTTFEGFLIKIVLGKHGGK